VILSDIEFSWDLKGASFGFTTVTDTWRSDGGLLVRELVDIDIREVSLTAFPSYPQTDVTVAQRSLQAWRGAGSTKSSVAVVQRRLRIGR
jgi:phage head maturation protease